MSAALPAALIASLLAAWTQQPPDAGRVRPPDAVDCPRDRLTAYTGRVVRLTREADRTVLEFRTDWETSEQVIVAHRGAGGPAMWFRVRGEPFGPDGWKVIESLPGQLRPGVRATAWVCEDGRNPIVDWNPAAEPPPPGR